MRDCYTGSKSTKTQYDWSNTVPSRAVINSIASIKNIEPAKLPIEEGITLYEYVDPESLDSLVTNDSSISITFTIDDCKIQIEGNEMTVSYD